MSHPSTPTQPPLRDAGGATTNQNASTSSTSTVYHTLQTTAVLPPLDMKVLQPSMVWNLDGITGAIKTLWDAISEQRGLFELMEKENNRRRLETDVKMNNMQSSLEALVAAEAKKRQQEDDKLRAEIAKVREETLGVAQALREEVKQLDASVKDSMETMQAKVRAQVLQLQEQIGAVRQDAATAKTTAEKAQESVGAVDKKLTTVADQLGTDINNLYQVVGVTKADAAGAVQRGTEKETMLQTPALVHLARLIKGVNDRADALGRDVLVVQDKVADSTRRVGACESEVAGLKGLPEKVNALDKDLRQTISTEDGKLLDRIMELEKRRGGLQPHPPTGGAYDDTAVWEAIRDLQRRISDINAQLNGKAPNSAIDELRELIRALQERMENALANLPKSVEYIPLPPKAEKVAGPSYDANALIALKDGLSALEARMNSAENHLDDLQANKADRSELASAIRDALAAFEQAINHLYGELQKLASLIPLGDDKVDATAGRFKCLSCNRDAGPLSEPIRERLSQLQFPPSNVLMARDGYNDGSVMTGNPSAGLSPTRGSASKNPTIPGVRDNYGGPHMTASRRKLQNYFESLQRMGNQQQQQPAQQPVKGVPQPNMAASATAQGGPQQQYSIEGDPSTAVGADGKYYLGVTVNGVTVGRVRPRSAGGNGRNPSPAPSTPSQPQEQQPANTVANVAAR